MQKITPNRPTESKATIFASCCNNHSWKKINVCDQNLRTLHFVDAGTEVPRQRQLDRKKAVQHYNENVFVCNTLQHLCQQNDVQKHCGMYLPLENKNSIRITSWFYQFSPCLETLMGHSPSFMKCYIPLTIRQFKTLYETISFIWFVFIL